MSTVLEALRQPQFADGVRSGLVTVVIVATIGLATRLWCHRPAPLAGVGIAIAALMAVAQTRDIPTNVLWGVALAGLAGLLVDVTGCHPSWLVPAALPSALLLATAPGIGVSVGDAGLRYGAVVVAVVIGGPLVVAFDCRWQRLALAPGLLAVTTGGMYATVPDTEASLAVLGAAIVIAGTGWPLRLAHLGGAGALATVAVLTWTVAAIGGRGRDGSIVGAIAALGLLLVEPVVRLSSGRSAMDRLTPRTAVLLACVFHAGLTAWASRVAGLRDGAGGAALLATLGFVVGGVGWILAGGRQPAPATSAGGEDADRG